MNPHGGSCIAEDGEWYPATVKDSLGKGKYVVESLGEKFRAKIIRDIIAGVKECVYKE